MSNTASRALAAYWHFFEGFNSRSAASWADGLNFPHSRISPNGEPQSILSAAEHMKAMSWNRVKQSGWDHSVGAQPTVVHASPDCCHVVGGWSRYTRDGEVIMTNHVSYVITRMTVNGSDHWGMQARFGVDPGPGGLSDEHAPTAVAIVHDFFAALEHQCLGEAAINLPLVWVRAGRVEIAHDTRQVRTLLEAQQIDSVRECPIRSVQAGPRAVNVAVGGDDQAMPRALLLVTERDGHWGIQALSIIGSAAEQEGERRGSIEPRA
jgi:hypothetical protein